MTGFTFPSMPPTVVVGQPDRRFVKPTEDEMKPICEGLSSKIADFLEVQALRAMFTAALEFNDAIDAFTQPGSHRVAGQVANNYGEKLAEFKVALAVASTKVRS